MSISTSRVMEYDPFSQEFQADPFPVYRWMRDEAPEFYSEKWNWWALSRFEDVRAAATDPQTFLSYEGIDIDDTAKDQSGPGFLPDIDNPRHDQIRRMIQPQLLPNRIAEREDAVRSVVRGLIDAWRHRGTVDLAQELAWPTPNEVFFDLLGLPAAHSRHLDRGDVRGAEVLLAAVDVAGAQGGRGAAAVRRAAAAAGEHRGAEDDEEREPFQGRASLVALAATERLPGGSSR